MYAFVTTTRFSGAAFCPLLGEIGHFSYHIVPVLLHCEVRIKPDSEKFDRLVCPVTHDAVGQYMLAAQGAELQAN